MAGSNAAAQLAPKAGPATACSSRRTMASAVWSPPSRIGCRPGRCGSIRLSPGSFAENRIAGGWSSARATRRSFDAVIVALPAPAASRLLATCDAELAPQLSAIEYAGCAVVSVAYRSDQLRRPLDGFGFVVPRIENRPIIAGSFASEKFPGRAPAGDAIIRVFIGGALAPDLAELPEAELTRIAHEELAALLRIDGAPLWTEVARWPASMPQYHVGHLLRIAQIEGRAAKLRGLALAGNAYHGVGIPQCIHSGETAAERIAKLYN